MKYNIVLLIIVTSIIKHLRTKITLDLQKINYQEKKRLREWHVIHISHLNSGIVEYILPKVD